MPMLISISTQPVAPTREIRHSEIEYGFQTLCKFENGPTEKDTGKCVCQILEKYLPCASNVNGRKDNRKFPLIPIGMEEKLEVQWNAGFSKRRCNWIPIEFITCSFKTLHDLKIGHMKKEGVISYFHGDN